jgi:hypothetical protein
MHIADDTRDEDLMGAELVYGATSVGRVLDVYRDSVSHRIWRLITTYGPNGRRVGVPVEWIARQTPTLLTLAVGPRALDDLPDQRELAPAVPLAGTARVNGTAL